ncbi:hypothetical protein C8R44DRAFT_868499 [Mycena epipterygia]|nr:hypothetical protein C8R44DRAFT_868499 [Mycena epipterygia]
MSSNYTRFLSDINDIKLAFAIAGVSFSVLLLSAFAYLAWNPISRPHLNRVSFRLLVYALIANVLFGLLQCLAMKQTSPACSLVAFLGMIFPMLSACLFCCIGLNLQLVLIHGFNGNKMEKYYIFGSLLFCGICNLVPLAAGELGWYAANGTCWFRTPTLRWLVATQSVWMLLMSAVDFVSFFTLLVFMVRHHLRIQRLRMSTTYGSTSSESGMTLASTLPTHPIVRYRGMIIRIALYPFLSCFLSVTLCIVDVFTVQNSVDLNVRILGPSLHRKFTSIRPLLYALLAATDPSLLSALRALRPNTSTSHSTVTPLEWKQTASTDLTRTMEGDEKRRADSSDTQGNRDSRPSSEEQAALEEEEHHSESIAHQF